MWRAKLLEQSEDNLSSSVHLLETPKNVRPTASRGDVIVPLGKDKDEAFQPPAPKRSKQNRPPEPPPPLLELSDMDVPQRETKEKDKRVLSKTKKKEVEADKNVAEARIRPNKRRQKESDNEDDNVFLNVEEDIKRRQIEEELMIRKISFARTVRDVSVSFSGTRGNGDPYISWHVDAVNALQEAAEAFLVERFQDAKMCANHSNRHTIRPADMQLAAKIRGSSAK